MVLLAIPFVAIASSHASSAHSLLAQATPAFVSPTADAFTAWGAPNGGLQLAIYGTRIVHLAPPNGAEPRDLHAILLEAPAFILATYMPALRNVGPAAIDICTRRFFGTFTVYDDLGSAVPTSGPYSTVSDYDFKLPPIGAIAPKTTYVPSERYQQNGDLYSAYQRLAPGNYTLIEHIDLQVRQGKECEPLTVSSGLFTITVRP